MVNIFHLDSFLSKDLPPYFEKQTRITFIKPQPVYSTNPKVYFVYWFIFIIPFPLISVKVCPFGHEKERLSFG